MLVVAVSVHLEYIELTAVNGCNFQRLLSTAAKMELTEVVARLQQFAPTWLSETWDNVGLLVEPSSPHIVKMLMLTNDLTEAVANEAFDKGVSMILSYHPPIFKPLRRLTQHSWKERIVVKCIENRVAVYSPHTCYDALQGGVNDWLVSTFGLFFALSFLHPESAISVCWSDCCDVEMKKVGYILIFIVNIVHMVQSQNCKKSKQYKNKHQKH